MILIERHHALLEKVGLSTLDGVRSFQGEIIERIPGKRDVQRFRVKAESGRELVFYLKRHWRSDRKDALLSLLKHAICGQWPGWNGRMRAFFKRRDFTQRPSWPAATKST